MGGERLPKRVLHEELVGGGATRVGIATEGANIDDVLQNRIELKEFDIKAGGWPAAAHHRRRVLLLYV